MQEKSIKVSIIIPVYNMEKYLKECLDSVLSQTLVDIEVICIDDGSTDSSMNILSEYSRRYENFVVMQQSRKGAGPARNKGIEMARGEFVAFLDSDDMFASNDVLEYLYNGIKSSQVDMGGGSLCLLAEGKITRHPDKKQYISEADHIEDVQSYQFPFGFYRFLYNKDFLLRNSISFPDLVRNQDPVFMLDALIASGEIWLTSKEVYIYRQVDKKIEFTSTKVVSDILQGCLYMMKKAKEFQYEDLQELLLQYIVQQDNMFIMQICNGHLDIHNKLEMIGNYIIDDEKKKSFTEYWNLNTVRERFNYSQDKIRNIRACVESCQSVIIYGAGRYGKKMYDFINTIKDKDFLGFAVTGENPEGTARGYKIKALSDFKEYAENALVIIAVKDDLNNEMQNYAKKLGFQNIIYINEDISYIGINQVTEGKFAFDN